MKAEDNGQATKRTTQAHSHSHTHTKMNQTPSIRLKSVNSISASFSSLLSSTTEPGGTPFANASNNVNESSTNLLANEDEPEQTDGGNIDADEGEKSSSSKSKKELALPALPSSMEAWSRSSSASSSLAGSAGFAAAAAAVAAAATAGATSGTTGATTAFANYELDELNGGRLRTQWWESDMTRLFMRFCALLSLVSVSMNTSYTYAKVEHLIYLTFIIDIFVAFVFLFEFLAKLTHRGWHNYFSDRWSQFDFIMLLCLLLSLALHVLELTGEFV